MFLTFITILAITGLTVNGQIPGVINGCSSTAFSNRLDKCYTTSDPPNIGNVAVDDVVGLSARGGVNMTIACGAANKALYLAQTKCVLKSYRECGDNDYKTLVIEETDYEKAFDNLCKNLAGLQAFEDCFKIDSIFDCIRNKNAREKVTDFAKPDISSPFTDISDYHCQRLKIREECVADDKDVAACVGTSNNRALYEEFYKLKKASVCGASSIILASGLMVISLVASFVKF